MCKLLFLHVGQVIEAAIETGVEEVEVVEGDDEGTSWVLTDPKDVSHLAGARASGRSICSSILYLLRVFVTSVLHPTPAPFFAVYVYTPSVP